MKWWNMNEENWNKDKKKGAPPSGLFWTINESAFGAGDEKTALDMVRRLRMAILAINASPYEKNAHIIEFVAEGNAAESLKILEGLQAITSHSGLVLLVRDSLSLAAQSKADGIVFTDVEKAVEARSLIGDDPIIAAHLESVDEIPNNIDLAIFSDKCSMQDITKVKISSPCTVMSNVALNNENCGAYVQAGCDFLNASEYLNAHPESPAKAAVNMLYAIDLTVRPANAH
jgi:hypothetical protein|tara:strand:- start:54859 stop:55548 length:690 start_codon:yes stop_codon:yes gene_type:complete